MISTLIVVLIGVAAFVLGGGAAFFLWQVIAGRKLSLAREEAQRLVAEAKEKGKEVLLEAKEEAIKIRSAAEEEYRERRSELQRQEKRLAQKEENLERKTEGAERRERALAAKEKEAEKIRLEVEALRRQQVQQLETVAHLSTAEAKEILLQRVEGEIQEDAARRLHEIESRLKGEAEEKARQILSLAIQRCATDVVSETTVSVVPLPSDEMKGRLIGREGRNIRALEHATGVELIIDDTPEAVTLSCFDPVRREVARLALEKLILNGRIHPARIEEVVQKARSEVEATIQSVGEESAYRVGVHGLHPELIKLVGRLKYRFSYGQNVLTHSVEVALLASAIAAELGADVEVAKKAGLLHDVGKGVDFEAAGPHALVGAELVKQWEKSPQVVRGIGEHHGETDSNSLEGVIIATADALSGARPGARRESLGQYLKRLESLENIANSFPGVEKSFAIQAGREVRIMVKPEETDDLGAMRLARDIAKKIEENLEYPGQIRVTVIRETRVVDYAK